MGIETISEGSMAKRTAGPAGNGSNKAPAAGAAAGRPTVKPATPREARQLRMSQGFAQVVAVLMRDANFRNMRLADLEWLVLPAILSGQFKLGHARAQAGKDKSKPESGTFVPVAVALWARVSPAIDKVLSESLDKPLQLKANQWASGDIPWLVAAAGDPRTLPAFLKQLGEQEFKGQQVKLRARGPDGSVVVKTLDAYK